MFTKNDKDFIFDYLEKKNKGSIKKHTQTLVDEMCLKSQSKMQQSQETEIPTKRNKKQDDAEIDLNRIYSFSPMYLMSNLYPKETNSFP